MLTANHVHGMFCTDLKKKEVRHNPPCLGAMFVQAYVCKPVLYAPPVG